MSLLVHATCSAALSFFFCCRWVDGVAMLSVVKRNILKGRFSPPSLCRGGGESGGAENKKRRKIYRRERGLSFVQPRPIHPPTHPHARTHTHTHTMYFYSFSFPKIVNFRIEENCLLFYFSFLLAPQHDTGLATRLRTVSIAKCLCLQGFSAVIRKHNIS